MISEGKEFTVHDICYPEESDMPRSYIRGSTVQPFSRWQSGKLDKMINHTDTTLRY